MNRYLLTNSFYMFSIFKNKGLLNNTVNHLKKNNTNIIINADNTDKTDNADNADRTDNADKTDNTNAINNDDTLTNTKTTNNKINNNNNKYNHKDRYNNKDNNSTYNNNNNKHNNRNRYNNKDNNQYNNNSSNHHNNKKYNNIGDNTHKTNQYNNAKYDNRDNRDNRDSKYNNKYNNNKYNNKDNKTDNDGNLESSNHNQYNNRNNNLSNNTNNNTTSNTVNPNNLQIDTIPYYSIPYNSNQTAQKLNSLITNIQQSQQKYYTMLLNPQKYKMQQLAQLNYWMQKFCDFKKYQSKYSLLTLMAVLKYTKHQRAYAWRFWVFNRFGIDYFIDKNYVFSQEGNQNSNQESQASIFNNKNSNVKDNNNNINGKNNNGSNNINGNGNIPQYKSINNNKQQQQQQQQPQQQQLTIVGQQSLSHQQAQFLIINIVQIFQFNIKQQTNKNKKVRIKLRFLQFLFQNIQKISSIPILSIILYRINLNINNLSMLQKIRFGRVCQIVDKSFCKRYQNSKEYRNTMYHMYQGYQLLLQILKLFSNCHYSPNTRNNNTQQILVKLTMRQYQITSYRGFRHFFTLFRFFPNSVNNQIITSSSNSTTQIVYHRKNILQWFLTKMSNNIYFKQTLQSYQPISYIETNIIYIIQIYLYEAYMKLQTSYVDNFLTIIDKPTLPVINQTVWQMYEIVGSKMKMRNPTIYQFYHKYYKQNRNDKKIYQINQNRIRLYEDSLDNQASIRLSKALQQLDIQYKRQIKVSQKMVDFVTDDNIIIQCDGDAHIDYYQLEVSQKTGFRNYIHMLDGYKVISVSFLEINKARGNQEYLVNLLKSKIEIVRRDGIYYVQ